MRSDSAGAPPGLSIDNTTALTLGFANAVSRMGMMCLAAKRFSRASIQASRDLALYEELGPGNLAYDFQANGICRARNSG
jgi:hypothetical protein